MLSEDAAKDKRKFNVSAYDLEKERRARVWVIG
jgi:hypothetical protein